MIRLLSGDCRDVLATLPAESVQCCVTSPPYYGLRDYGTALWDGGDAGCDHVKTVYKPQSYAGSDSKAGKNCQSWRGGERNQSEPYGDVCGKCGAVRVDRQIGLEATPDLYLETMVAVFREVRRVLRRDGTCWVNMGDSYVSGPTGSLGTRVALVGGQDNQAAALWRPDKSMHGKPKDLLLMPARLALALQADGWWIRSDVIWHKPNPMPESVTDRPTSAHEHVFLLTKSARYFYDADAVRERVGEEIRRNTEFRGESTPYKNNQSYNNSSGIVNYVPAGEPSLSGRSLRNVWTIATHAYPDAHFATFPPELAERCIKAGTSERGCCAACGKPWVREGDKALVDVWHRNRKPSASGLDFLAQQQGDQGACRARNGHVPGHAVQFTTTGWSPGCQCNADVVPCTVLDPFAGAGTTLLVADRLQRDCIGIELNTAYTEMAMERCRADAPLFTSFPPAEDPEEARMGDLFTDMAAD